MSSWWAATQNKKTNLTARHLVQSTVERDTSTNSSSIPEPLMLGRAALVANVEALLLHIDKVHADVQQDSRTTKSMMINFIIRAVFLEIARLRYWRSLFGTILDSEYTTKTFTQALTNPTIRTAGIIPKLDTFQVQKRMPATALLQTHLSPLVQKHPMMLQIARASGRPIPEAFRSRMTATVTATAADGGLDTSSSESKPRFPISGLVIPPQVQLVLDVDRTMCLLPRVVQWLQYHAQKDFEKILEWFVDIAHRVQWALILPPKTQMYYAMREVANMSVLMKNPVSGKFLQETQIAADIYYRFLGKAKFPIPTNLIEAHLPKHNRPQKCTKFIHKFNTMAKLVSTTTDRNGGKLESSTGKLSDMSSKVIKSMVICANRTSKLSTIITTQVAHMAQTSMVEHEFRLSLANALCPQDFAPKIIQNSSDGSSSSPSDGSSSSPDYEPANIAFLQCPLSSILLPQDLSSEIRAVLGG